MDLQKADTELATRFDQESYNTNEYKSFARSFKSTLKKIGNENGFKIAKFSVGHFYISGFLEMKDGKLIYFSHDNGSERILVRTAKHLKDFASGHNNYCLFSELGEKVNYINHYHNLS